MKNTATNFSYFLPRHIFNSCETQELYPAQIRPSDPELTVDKAMTMLNIAEDQIFKFQAAEPFNPADFGFTELPLEGENEFDASVVYVGVNDIPYTITPTKKAMTWEIAKTKDTDHGDDIRSYGTEWEITAFIPNKVIGAIILQSLGVIELVNPEGVYVIPDVTEATEAPKETIDRSLPVLVFEPKTWTDPKDLDAFLIEQKVINEAGEQNRLAMFLVPEALNAMRQIRFLIQERNTGRVSFEGVPEAIEAHPNFTPQQKEKMHAEWNADPAEEGNDQNEGALAPIQEVAPTE